MIPTPFRIEDSDVLPHRGCVLIKEHWDPIVEGKSAVASYAAQGGGRWGNVTTTDWTL
jgi:hypothetical protein